LPSSLLSIGEFFVKKLLLVLAMTFAAAAQGATGVSAPDTLDSKAPVIQFVYPAGAEVFSTADQETLRFTIGEPSWGPPPAGITMTIMPSGNPQTTVGLTPEPDGSYLYVWDIPELPFTSEAETRIRILAYDRFGWLGARYSAWFTVTEAVSPVPVAVLRDRLGPVHPNPFNPRTTVSFSLAGPADIDLEIYDVRGRQIATLDSGRRAAGDHEATWQGLRTDGSPAASGVYFARLTIRGEHDTRTLVTRLALVK
jgi:hypothetical protein